MKTKKEILYLSPSSLNLYLICPKLFANKNIKLQDDKILKFGSFIHEAIELWFKSDKKKDICKIATSIFTNYNLDMDDYNDGLKILKEFLNREYLKYKVLAFEQEFKDILPNGVALKGRIDLIVERDESTVEIIDFKSGFAYYNIMSLGKNHQLKIYKALVYGDERFKKYKNFFITIDPLRFTPVSVISDEISDEVFWEYLENIYLKILNDNKFEANFPNMRCKTCPITNVCEPYKQLLTYDYKIKKSFDEKLEHFSQLQDIKTTIESDLKFYKNYFTDYMVNNVKTESIKINKFHLTLKNNKLSLRNSN